MMVSCVEQINTNHNGNKKIGKNGKIKVKHNYHSYSVRYFLTNFTQYRQIYLGWYLPNLETIQIYTYTPIFSKIPPHVYKIFF